MDYRQVLWGSSFRSESEATTSLIVNFLLVVDVAAGSAEQTTNHRALSATDQRATQCAYACAYARALDSLARCVFAVVIIVVVTTIASVIVIVIPGGGIVSTSAASVLRQRARSGGG